MNRKRNKILQSPSTLRIRLSRHLAFSYLTQAAFYMVLVIAWLYWYVTYIWNRIGPDSGGRIELPRIVLFMIGFGLPVAIWFLYTVFSFKDTCDTWMTCSQPRSSLPPTRSSPSFSPKS